MAATDVLMQGINIKSYCELIVVGVEWKMKNDFMRFTRRIYLNILPFTFSSTFSLNFKNLHKLSGIPRIPQVFQDLSNTEIKVISTLKMQVSNFGNKASFTVQKWNSKMDIHLAIIERLILYVHKLHTILVTMCILVLGSQSLSQQSKHYYKMCIFSFLYL